MTRYLHTMIRVTDPDADGNRIEIGASVGIAMAPGDGDDCDTLLKNADLALYRAKAEGRGRYRFFVTEMDELFLLVVAGEYNAGKSTFINALLGDEVFAMGDLPTTRVISILRYGEPGPPEPVGEHTRVYRYPLEMLRDLEIVDTPGTNSIERMEEEITRGFVPRADLVLFVTSADRPFTETERAFLESIRDWGKKVEVTAPPADQVTDASSMLGG